MRTLKEAAQILDPSAHEIKITSLASKFGLRSPISIRDIIKLSDHVVNLSKIYRDECGEIVYVEIDRSNGYWGGDILIRVINKEEGIVEEISVPSGTNRIEIHGTYKGYYSLGLLKLKAYAVVGGQLIESPELYESSHYGIYFSNTDRCKVEHFIPGHGDQGKVIKVEIHGKRFPSSINDVNVYDKRNDKDIKINVISCTSNLIIADFNLTNAINGKHEIIVSRSCSGVCEDNETFDVVKAEPTPQILTAFISLKRQSIYSGITPYKSDLWPAYGMLIQIGLPAQGNPSVLQLQLWNNCENPILSKSLPLQRGQYTTKEQLKTLYGSETPLLDPTKRICAAYAGSNSVDSIIVEVKWIKS